MEVWATDFLDPSRTYPRPFHLKDYPSSRSLLRYFETWLRANRMVKENAKERFSIIDNFENGQRDSIHLGGGFMKVYGFTNLQAFL